MLHRALSEHGNVDLFLAVNENELPPSHLSEIQSRYPGTLYCEPIARGEQRPWRWLKRLAPTVAYRLADLLASRRFDYQPDSRMSSILRERFAQRRYDLVVAKGLGLAMKTGIPPNFPFLLDVDDAEQEWYRSIIHSPCSTFLARWVAKWRLSQVEQTVPSLYKQFSHCWVVKNCDLMIDGLENSTYLGVPYCQPDGGLPPLAPSNPASKVIMMLGSYYHRPNAEGLDWFVRRVWPRVKATAPDAEFRIIGPGLSPRRAKAYGRISGIRILGTVPSVLPQYQKCAFTVAPIWTGAGINVKVLESYAFGRTCVLTSFAYRGYEDCLELDQSVRVASNPEDYASACIDLLRDPSLRDRLAAAGHPNVLRDFSFERFAGVVGETVFQIINLKN
jgi:hypothetical protein